MKICWKLIYIKISIIFLITKIIGLNLRQNKIQTNTLPASYQFQLIINNKTSNVNSNYPKVDPDDSNSPLLWEWFYIDLSINGKVYNYDDFKLNDKSKMIAPENPKNGSGNHKDVFATPSNSKVTLLSLIYNTNFTNAVTIYFTFGTYYDGGGNIWYHAQLTSANNYEYNFINQFVKTRYAGTKLIINANGSDNANNANWGFQYYKFCP